ncbi:MAG: hypothetical protein HY074_05835 [Deltaproteobacteria bacterium]|nr:hypothetical protein [Deltaproteobacteria bacterium]
MRKPKLALISAFNPMLLSLTLTCLAHAGELDRCGDYVVQGDLEVNHASNEAVLRIRKKSSGELRVHIRYPETGSNVPLYDHKKVQASVAIAAKPTGPDSVADNLSELLLLPRPGQAVRDVALIQARACGGSASSRKR